MLSVALTGNIASGKTEVARLLAERGATIIDADLLARAVVAPGEPAWGEIRERWGEAVVRRDGSLDRAALRDRVFRDASEREALNAIVHPRVGELREQLVAEARARGDRIVVSDIPLLFETGLEAGFDRVLLVDAPAPVRLARLLRTRGLDEAEAGRIMASQADAVRKRPRADYVIDNDSTLDDLARRVDAVWEALERDAAARDAP